MQAFVGTTIYALASSRPSQGGRNERIRMESPSCFSKLSEALAVISNPDDTLAPRLSALEVRKPLTDAVQTVIYRLVYQWRSLTRAKQVHDGSDDGFCAFRVFVCDISAEPLVRDDTLTHCRTPEESSDADLLEQQQICWYLVASAKRHFFEDGPTFSMDPAAKPTTTIRAFQATHLRLGRIMPQSQYS